MNNIQQVLAWAQQRLGEEENPVLEAQILLAHVLGCDRAHVIAWPEKALAEAQVAQYSAFVERRVKGEPVAYLVGEKEFWSTIFTVTPATLIPRPETEKLVEVVLEVLPEQAITVVDVGTGSGIIACTLARLRPMWRVIGVDCSGSALAVARSNAQRLGLERIQWVHSEWLHSLRESQVEAIVSNPPYLREADPHLITQKGLAFEPREALVAGKTGLEAYEIIAKQAAMRLAQGGHLIVEHGDDQGSSVRSLFKMHHFEEVDTRQDWGGRERVTRGKQGSLT